MSQWREAQHVFLAACKRLYAVIPSAKNDEEVSDFFYSFLAPQTMPIELNYAILAEIRHLVNGSEASAMSYSRQIEELEELFDSFNDESAQGVVVAFARQWKPWKVEKILALEEEGRLRLKVDYGGWLEEISYRGEYAIMWETPKGEMETSI